MNKTFIKNYLVKIAKSHCGAVERQDITDCTDAYIKTLKVRDWNHLDGWEKEQARANIITMCYKILLDNNIHMWNVADKTILGLYEDYSQVFTYKIKCGKVIL